MVSEKFEWDEIKRKSNIAKHSIDFIDAVKIFDDTHRIERPIIKNNEQRVQTIGLMDDIVIFVVYTIRNSKIRIISARCANKIEREAYFDA